VKTILKVEAEVGTIRSKLKQRQSRNNRARLKKLLHKELKKCQTETVSQLTPEESLIIL